MDKASSERIKNGLRVINFSETTPLFIAARAIGKAVVGLSPKTLANWRSYGRGPKYYLKNGSVYYRLKDLDDFFGQNPVETDEEKVKNMEDGNAYKCL